MGVAGEFLSEHGCT